MADFFDKTGNVVIDDIIEGVVSSINIIKNGNITNSEDRERLMNDANIGVSTIGAYHAMSDILSSDNPQVAYKSLLNANNGLDREFYQMVAQQMASFQMENAFNHVKLDTDPTLVKLNQFIHMDMTSQSISDSQKLNAIYSSVNSGSEYLIALMSDKNGVIQESQLKSMVNLVDKDISGSNPSAVQVLAYQALNNTLNTISEMHNIRTMKTECPSFNGVDVHGYKAGSIAPYSSFDDMIKSVRHYDVGDDTRFYDESAIRTCLENVQSGKIISDDFSEVYFQNILANQIISMSSNKFLDDVHNLSFRDMQSAIKKELKNDRGLGQEFYHTLANDYVVNQIIEDSKSYPECPVPSKEVMATMNPELKHLYHSYEKFGVKGIIDSISFYGKISPDMIDIALSSYKDKSPTDLFIRGVLGDIKKANADMTQTWATKGPLLCMDGDVTFPKTYADKDGDNWLKADGTAPEKKLVDVVTYKVTHKLQKFLNNAKTLNVGNKNLVSKLSNHVANLKENVASNIQDIRQQTMDSVRGKLKDGSSQVKYKSQNTLKAGIGKFMNAKTYTSNKSSNLMDKLKGHYTSFMEKIGDNIQKKQNKLTDYKNRALVSLDNNVINNNVNRSLISTFRNMRDSIKDTRDTFNYIRNMKNIPDKVSGDIIKIGQNVAFLNSYSNIKYTGITMNINMSAPDFKVDGLAGAVNSMKPSSMSERHNENEKTFSM